MNVCMKALAPAVASRATSTMAHLKCNEIGDEILLSNSRLKTASSWMRFFHLEPSL